MTLSFDSEWGDIRVERLTTDRGEIEAIKRMLCANWAHLSDVYACSTTTLAVGPPLPPAPR